VLDHSGDEDFPVIDLKKREVRKETSVTQAESSGMWKTASSYCLVYMFLVTLIILSKERAMDNHHNLSLAKAAATQ